MTVRNLLPACTTTISLLGAIALSVESYLNTQNTSLCKTTACEVVGHYIKIGEPLLTAGGAAFFWFLTLSFFFSYRYPKQLELLPILFLFPALAFDGVLIGFQFVTIKQQCILCISVATFLVGISLFFLLANHRKLLAICCILVWFAGFTGSSIITMPEPQNAYSRMVLYSKSATPHSAFKEQPNKMTLIFSMQCPHCLHVVDYLKEQNTSETTWAFASTDLDNKSLSQLNDFLNKAPITDNLFKLIHEIKTQQAPSPEKPYFSIKKQNSTTISFLSNLGINTIPVLVVEQHKSEKRIITSSSAIIKFFNQFYKDMKNEKEELSSR